MPSLGPGELLLIALLILVLFGAKKIPELMRGLGEGMRELRKATREASDDLHRLASEDEPPPAGPPPGAAS